MLSGNVTPTAAALARTWAGSPSSTQRAIPFRAQMAAALSVRGSSPSGSTIRLFACLAISTTR